MFAYYVIPGYIQNFITLLRVNYYRESHHYKKTAIYSLSN